MKPLWLQTPAQLSNHLRSLRKARGLTQAALGELAGLDQTRIAKIERNPRRVSVGQLMQLLSVLHVRVLLQLLRRDNRVDSLRIFVGHAGWAPGQLEAEIARRDWTLKRAEREAIFSDKSQHPWPSPRAPKRGT